MVDKLSESVVFSLFASNPQKPTDYFQLIIQVYDEKIIAQSKETCKQIWSGQ